VAKNNYRLVRSEGSFSDKDITVRQEYVVPANELWSFAQGLLPLPIVRGKGNIFSKGYKVLPGLGNAPVVAKSVRWRPLDESKPVDPFEGIAGKEGSFGQYVLAEVEYGLLENEGNKSNQSNDPSDTRTLVEIRGRAAGDFLAVPVSRGGEWTEIEITGGEPKEIAEPISFNIPCPIIEWSVKWPDLPYEFAINLICRCRSSLGKVNSGSFGLLFNAPADTVLFLSLDYDESKSVKMGEGGRITTEIKASVEMHFSEKGFYQGGKLITHQHVYRKGYGWRKPKFQGGRYLYDRTDLDSLFR